MNKENEVPQLRFRKGIIVLIAFGLIVSYFAFISNSDKLEVPFNDVYVEIPVPDFSPELTKTTPPITVTYLHPYLGNYLEIHRQEIIAARRQEQIDKVERFFEAYGSPLKGYGHIFVDQSEKCGGDYRVLVGIAGSESGLGRVNVLQYNPFGYLNNVQYSSQEEALTILACKVSEQHISRCGTDLYCLVRRYAGPQDDPELFVSKVRWFMKQVS